MKRDMLMFKNRRVEHLKMNNNFDKGIHPQSPLNINTKFIIFSFHPITIIFISRMQILKSILFRGTL